MTHVANTHASGQPQMAAHLNWQVVGTHTESQNSMQLRIAVLKLIESVFQQDLEVN